MQNKQNNHTEADKGQERKQKKGRIHVYSGDGKGKTTAATGLTFRAAARDWKIFFIQFLKSGNSAELKLLRKLDNVEVVSGQKIGKFTFLMSEEEKRTAFEEMQGRLEEAIARADEFDMIVLDEALGAISTGLIQEEVLLKFMQEKPDHLELVLTGRGPSEAIIAEADYHSEICMRKHPYVTEGLDARPGVEF